MIGMLLTVSKILYEWEYEMLKIWNWHMCIFLQRLVLSIITVGRPVTRPPTPALDQGVPGRRARGLVRRRADGLDARRRVRPHGAPARSALRLLEPRVEVATPRRRRLGRSLPRLGRQAQLFLLGRHIHAVQPGQVLA
jgi:hypothetical protein